MVLPVDDIIPLLREMRRGSTAEVETLKTNRDALGAEGWVGKILTDEFEQRLSVVERRLSDLETTK